jgi:SpoVK/Ycf46/Vps4 family AAA+-type ATPase
MIKAVLTFDDGSLAVHSSNIEKVSEKFDSGVYKASATESGININKQEIDEVHSPYAHKTFQNIFQYCKEFLKEELKEKINKMGFLHKLGVLLYGPAGTGKTSYLIYLADLLIKEKDAIVFLADSTNTMGTSIELAKEIRKIQNNPIIIIADEFERWARNYESEMKTFLDGVDSVDNLIFLAATNYIDKVPDTLKSRPSRFKIVAEIGGIDDPKVIKDIIVSKSSISQVLSNEEIDAYCEEAAEKSSYS